MRQKKKKKLHNAAFAKCHGLLGSMFSHFTVCTLINALWCYNVCPSEIKNDIGNIIQIYNIDKVVRKDMNANHTSNTKCTTTVCHFRPGAPVTKGILMLTTNVYDKIFLVHKLSQYEHFKHLQVFCSGNTSMTSSKTNDKQ